MKIIIEGTPEEVMEYMRKVVNGGTPPSNLQKTSDWHLPEPPWIFTCDPYYVAPVKYEGAGL